MNNALPKVLDQSWPDEAQRDLEHVTLEIDAELPNTTYRATAEELAGIERGLRAAEQGQFARDKEVESVFAKYVR